MTIITGKDMIDNFNRFFDIVFFSTLSDADKIKCIAYISVKSREEIRKEGNIPLFYFSSFESYFKSLNVRTPQTLNQDFDELTAKSVFIKYDNSYAFNDFELKIFEKKILQVYIQSALRLLSEMISKVREENSVQMELADLITVLNRTSEFCESRRKNLIFDAIEWLKVFLFMLNKIETGRVSISGDDWRNAKIEFVKLSMLIDELGDKGLFAAKFWGLGGNCLLHIKSIGDFTKILQENLNARLSKITTTLKSLSDNLLKENFKNDENIVEPAYGVDVKAKISGGNCLVSDKSTCKIQSLEKGLVFIGGSSDVEFTVDVKTISDLLKREGYKPYFATNEESYNQNAFCTKICSRIMAAEFCIFLLNDPVHNLARNWESKVRMSSPNVYFEYGFATAFSKKIIPIQKNKQHLPFNVRHLDILKYHDLNELESKLIKKLTILK